MTEPAKEKHFYPVLSSETIPDDPTLSELQAHAQALGMRLHLVLTGPEGVKFDTDTETLEPRPIPEGGTA